MAVPGRLPVGVPLTEFPAGTVNALVDDYWARRGQPPNKQGQRKPLGSTPYIVIWVENDSGAHVEPGHVLGINDVLITIAEDPAEFGNFPKAKGVTPDIGIHKKSLAICLDYIESGAVGRAVFLGAANSYVYCTDETHQFAEIKTGDKTSLQSATSGYPCYYYEPIPGDEYLPAVLRAMVILGGGGEGVEQYRLIRGQSVGAQSAASIFIDNVLVLSGGLDPSGGVPTVNVAVANLAGQSFADNEFVQAIYSPSIAFGDWEAIITTGTAGYSLVRGLVKGTFAASAGSIIIDGVTVLAGSADPVAGNPLTELTVFNSQLETFHDNEPVTAIFDGINPWRTLIVERCRMIRGQVSGSAVTGADTVFPIYNIETLQAGLDPRSNPANTAETVMVRNWYGDSYASNAWVTAVWNYGVHASADWEALKKPEAGTEQNRLIRGLAKGAVVASAATFPIDTVLPLSTGLDPVAGNPATEITVKQVFKEAFADDTPITAIYDQLGSEWEIVAVERKRLVMGEATSAVTTATGSFTIDSIQVLASGTDPRINPASSAETILIWNVHSHAFANDEKVIAVYNVSNHHWEALPKTTAATGGQLSMAVVYSGISAATVSGTDIDPGMGSIKKFTRPGTIGANWVFVDAAETAWNIFFDAFPVDCIVWVDNENYVVSAGCILMP